MSLFVTNYSDTTARNLTRTGLGHTAPSYLNANRFITEKAVMLLEQLSINHANPRKHPRDRERAWERRRPDDGGEEWRFLLNEVWLNPHSQFHNESFPSSAPSLLLPYLSQSLHVMRMWAEDTHRHTRPAEISSLLIHSHCLNAWWFLRWGDAGGWEGGGLCEGVRLQN